MTIDEFGCEVWKNDDGKFHREDGPAYVRSFVVKKWYINGELHREGGPAVVWNSIYDDEYWLGGVNLTEEEYKKKERMLKIKKLRIE